MGQGVDGQWWVQMRGLVRLSKRRLVDSEAL